MTTTSLAPVTYIQGTASLRTLKYSFMRNDYMNGPKRSTFRMSFLSQLEQSSLLSSVKVRGFLGGREAALPRAWHYSEHLGTSGGRKPDFQPERDLKGNCPEKQGDQIMELVRCPGQPF